MRAGAPARTLSGRLPLLGSVLLLAQEGAGAIGLADVDGAVELNGCFP